MRSGQPLFAMARILIVEDNSDFARALTALLQWSGHEAHAIRDGGAALRAAERLAPDVVISDIELPSMNGNSLATALRHRYGDELRLVALTADDDSGSRKRMEHAGFDAILIKPASLEDILEAIQQRTSASDDMLTASNGVR
jgi:CheY-like chemotaxis protein